MLNWDTGLGLARWMKAKTWAYAQQGLLTIAASRHFLSDPEYGPWAKHLFDRGLALYERDADRRRHARATRRATSTGRPPSTSRPATSACSARGWRPTRRARSRSASGRCGRRSRRRSTRSTRDTRRLAVSTPRYGTAIVPDNRGAFPYGGGEPARLFDAAGRPVGGIGGRGLAAFGLVVRGPHGRMATQGPAGRCRARPRAARRRSTSCGRTATTSGKDASITAHHRFTERFIETTWTIHRHAKVTVEAQFPTWRGAVIEAVHADGHVTRLGASPLALDDVDALRARRLLGRRSTARSARAVGVAQAVDRAAARADARRPRRHRRRRCAPASPCDEFRASRQSLSA